MAPAVAIDGCESGCASRRLEAAGIRAAAVGLHELDVGATGVPEDAAADEALPAKLLERGLPARRVVLGSPVVACGAVASGVPRACRAPRLARGPTPGSSASVAAVPENAPAALALLERLGVALGAEIAVIGRQSGTLCVAVAIRRATIDLGQAALVLTRPPAAERRSS